MKALTQDHLNDVFSNIIALVCGTLGKKKKYNNIHFYIFNI